MTHTSLPWSHDEWPVAQTWPTPVYLGVTLHLTLSSPSCNCLPSQRPLNRQTSPVNGKMTGKSASVVNSSLVDDSTIWKRRFSLPWRYWSKITIFRLTKVTVHPATKRGALQQVTSVSVANVKRRFTSSTAAHRPSWSVTYHSFTWLPQTTLEADLPQLHLAPTDQAGGWPTTA